MPFGYRTGVFKPCLTQQRCVFHFEKRRRQVCKWISEDSLEEKLRRKDSLFIQRLSCCFLLAWLAHKKKQKNKFIVLSDPLCFEASTEARRAQNTNGPLNWPSNGTLWKSHGCRRADGTILQDNRLFPLHWEIWKTHIRCLVFMMLLSEVATLSLSE